MPTVPDDDVFQRILSATPRNTEEIRLDDTATDRYVGFAPDGTPETVAAWAVIRMYRRAADIVRIRFRKGIAWSDRGNAANWS